MENAELGKTAESLKEALARILQQAQNSTDIQAFKETQKLNTYVIKPSVSIGSKKLESIRTNTLLDDKFFDAEGKSIGGLPCGTSTIITGLPNSGKSIYMEELALRLCHSGFKVCYAITEEIFKTDGKRYDLQTRLKEKASILKVDWDRVMENLFVLDSVTYPELRDWATFVASYKGLVEDKGVSMLLVDSMTLLEDSRGQVKFRVLELVRYNQLKNVTSIMITQRSVDESDNMAMAGGISLGYSVDIVLVLDYKKAWSGDTQLKLDTNCKQGDVINFMRILKCRVCRYDAHYFGYKISLDGLVVQTTVPPSQ
jgi:KaiC/GvpD/RAD55 family RecA-like ATPase